MPRTRNTGYGRWYSPTITVSPDREPDRPRRVFTGCVPLTRPPPIRYSSPQSSDRVRAKRLSSATPTRTATATRRAICGWRFRVGSHLTRARLTHTHEAARHRLAARQCVGATENLQRAVGPSHDHEIRKPSPADLSRDNTRKQQTKNNKHSTREIAAIDHGTITACTYICTEDKCNSKKMQNAWPRSPYTRSSHHK